MTDISEKAARLVERLRKVANGLWGEDEDAVLEAISFLLDRIESTPIDDARARELLADAVVDLYPDKERPDFADGHFHVVNANIAIRAIMRASRES